MLINEICRKCNVTKKAVEYYEKQGLIKSKYSNNNYRCFDDDDVALLKEIAILRKLNISVSDIRTIITSADRHKALSVYKVKQELQMQQMKVQHDCLNYLLDNDVTLEEAIDTLNRRLDENIVIKDRLRQAFPGTYGMYLCLHFGRFLNEKIDSDEKTLAYYRIVEFLDNIDDAQFPEDLKQFLEESFNTISEADLQELDESMNTAINDSNKYITENKDNITKYLEYRNSQEYKSSPAYKMQQLLIKFQKSSGYYDGFVSNLKILSSSYCEHQEKLESANTEFLNKYPEAKNILR